MGSPSQSDSMDWDIETFKSVRIAPEIPCCQVALYQPVTQKNRTDELLTLPTVWKLKSLRKSVSSCVAFFRVRI